MKVIFILLLACLFIANGKRLVVPKATLVCPQKCDCPTIYQPVCGKSGNTHGNSCLARCFKDPVSKVGACEPKCLKDTIKKKSSCKVEPYGRTGTRNYCCKWVEVNGLKRNEICNYKGPATYVSEKSSCKWKKITATKRQRVCCTFTRTRVGHHKTDSKKKCTNVGEPVELKHKIGCSKRPFGKFGLRNYCCSHKTVCVGKSCKISQRLCSYKGPVYTERKLRRCKWVQKKNNLKQVKCCSFIQNCKVNHKTHKKRCLKRGKKCQFVGKIIKSNKIKKCTLKPYGKNGLRNHCCTFNKTCKGKRCRHTNIKCRWEGCAKYQRLKYSCSFVHVKKNTIRKQCCKWNEVSFCKNKRYSAKRCHWAGKPVVTVTKNGCKWKQNGANSRKLVCCQYFRQYYGKKCHKTKKCVVRRIIRTIAHSSCKWRHFSKTAKRRKCCSVQKRCEGVFNPIHLKTVRKVYYLNKKGKMIKRKGKKHSNAQKLKIAKKMRKEKKLRKIRRNLKKFNKLRKSFLKSIKKHIKKVRTFKFGKKLIRTKKLKILHRLHKKHLRIKKGKHGKHHKRHHKKHGKHHKRHHKKHGKHHKRHHKKHGKHHKRHHKKHGKKHHKRHHKKHGKKHHKRHHKKHGKHHKRHHKKHGKHHKRHHKKHGKHHERNHKKHGKHGKKHHKKHGKHHKRHHKKGKHVKRNLRKHIKRNRRVIRKFKKVIHKPISWRCRVVKKSCKLTGPVVFNHLKKGCVWKKEGKFGKRKYCCKHRRICAGKKCNNYKKCRFVGKIVKVSVRKSCSVQNYGNNSSRRKLCCQWKNYCTGIKKFKCRPIQKKCTWVGKIHQKIEKTTCKWEKKTRRQRQRYCCRWFRSCVTSKKNGVHRNCQDGPKKCSWVGFIIRRSVKKACYFRRAGKYGRRKYCCKHLKKCQGKKCKVIKKDCKFVGPIYSRTPQSNCHWKKINKRQKRRSCCYFYNYCVNKKCTQSKKHCKLVGKTITTSKFRKCYWKQVVENGKFGRRRECCRFKKIKGSKGTKIIKHTCVFIGKMVLLEREYYKRDTKCTTSQNRKTCCKRIHKCEINNNQHKCTFFKNEKCVVSLIKVKVPKNPAICVSSGDPHYTTFNKKRFDYYKIGDYLLLESRSFTVHTRLRQWGGVSVNTGFAAKVNKAGESVQSESRDCSEITVHGNKKVKLSNGQKHYFRYGGYVQRSNSLLKVVSASGDYMDVQCIPYNNGNNKKYQDHYYNIVVKVANKHKYQSGFCVNSNPHRVKGLFNDNYKPKTQEPPKKCSVSKRAKVERECRKNGIKSLRGIQRCIIDCCYKMQPIVERAREILKDEEKLKRAPKKPKIVFPKPVHQKEGVCSSLGDPHYTTFTKKRFDNYWVGDFVIMKAKDFIVHARTRPWGKASVNKRIATFLNGDVVEAKAANKFKLNKNTEINLKVGQKYRLPKGGVVHRVSKTRVYYYSYKAGYLDADFIGTDKNRYVNLIIKVPHYPQTSGACQGNMVPAHGLFHKEVQAKKGKKMKVTRRCHDMARFKCKRRGIQKRYLTSCVIDVCAGLGTKGMRKGLKGIKQDK